MVCNFDENLSPDNQPFFNPGTQQHGKTSGDAFIVDSDKYISDTKDEHTERKIFDERLLSSIQACKTRAILTADQAVEIFKIKLSNHTATRSQTISPRSVACEFGVSEKAVRDIWKGRTWLRETMHLDPARAILAARLRPPGRPRLNLQISTASVEEATNHPDSRHAAEETQPSSSSPKDAKDYATSVSAPAHGQSANEVVWWDQFHSTCPTDADDSCSLPYEISASTVAVTQSDSKSIEDRSESGAETTPLPESSHTNDPFHDDWRYWPKLEEEQAAK